MKVLLILSMFVVFNSQANPKWLKIVKNDISNQLFKDESLVSFSVLRDDENKMVPVFNYDGEYTIQVASYKTEMEAINHAEKIKSNDPRVFYQPIKLNGKIWFRVNVGNFKDLNKAKGEYKTFLASTGEKNSFVTFLATDKKQQQVLFKGPAEEPKKRSVASTSDETKDFMYTVQVGSFKTAKEATDKMKTIGQKINSSGYIHKVTIKGQDWHRLYFGKFKDKSGVKSFLKSKNADLKGSFIKKVHPKHLN